MNTSQRKCSPMNIDDELTVLRNAASWKAAAAFVLLFAACSKPSEGSAPSPDASTEGSAEASGAAGDTGSIDDASTNAGSGAGDVADDDGSLEADVSPDTPPDTEPPAPDPTEAVNRLTRHCEQAVAAYCDAIFGCADGSLRQQLTDFFGVTSAEGCKSNGVGRRDSCLSSLDAVTAGRRTLSAEDADGCNALFATLTCDPFLRGDNAAVAAFDRCASAGVLSGLVARGSACVNGSDCFEAADTCRATDETLSRFVCAASQGLSCLGSALPCAAGQYCAPSASDPRGAGTCQSQAPLGASCDAPDGCIPPLFCSPLDPANPGQSSCVEGRPG
jgi:hypothetical protein